MSGESLETIVVPTPDGVRFHSEHKRTVVTYIYHRLDHEARAERAMTAAFDGIAGDQPVEIIGADLSEDQWLEAFIKRAGFTGGWRNLETSARRMARQAYDERSKLDNNQRRAP